MKFLLSLAISFALAASVLADGYTPPSSGGITASNVTAVGGVLANKTVSPPITGVSNTVVIDETNLPAWLQNPPVNIALSSVLESLMEGNAVPVGFGGDSMFDFSSGAGSTPGGAIAATLIEQWGLAGSLCNLNNNFSSPFGGRTNPFFQGMGTGNGTFFSGDKESYFYADTPTTETNLTFNYSDKGQNIFPANFGGISFYFPQGVSPGRETEIYNYLIHTNGGSIVLTWTNASLGSNWTRTINTKDAYTSTNGIWAQTNLATGTPGLIANDGFSVWVKSGTNITRGLDVVSPNQPGIIVFQDGTGGTYPAQRTYDSFTLKGQGTNALTHLYANKFGTKPGLYIVGDKHLFTNRDNNSETELQCALEALGWLKCLPTNVVIVVEAMTQRYGDVTGSDPAERYWWPWICAALRTNNQVAVYDDAFGRMGWSTNLVKLSGNDSDGIHLTVAGSREYGHDIAKYLNLMNPNKLSVPQMLSEQPSGTPPIIAFPLNEGSGNWQEQITGQIPAIYGTTTWTNDPTGLKVLYQSGTGNRQSYSTPVALTNLNLFGVNQSATVGGWLQYRTNNNGNNLIIIGGLKNGSSSTVLHFSVQTFSPTASRLYSNWPGAGDDGNDQNDGKWIDGSWHLVVISYDITRHVFEWYLDGKIKNEVTGVQDLSSTWAGVSNVALNVFGGTGNIAPYGPGAFYDWKFLRRFMPPSENAAWYNSGLLGNRTVAGDQTVAGTSATSAANIGTLIVTNSAFIPTNSAGWSTPFGRTANASVTNNNARATWIVGISFTDAAAGKPVASVSLPGFFTNSIAPLLLGVSGVATNFYSFPMNPNTTNTITDVSSGTGASISVILSNPIQ